MTSLIIPDTFRWEQRNLNENNSRETLSLQLFKFHLVIGQLENRKLSSSYEEGLLFYPINVSTWLEHFNYVESLIISVLVSQFILQYIKLGYRKRKLLIIYANNNLGYLSFY